MLPNYGYHIKNINKEKNLQLQWINNNIVNFKNMLGNKPFVFINGNHDFLESQIIEKELQKNNINAIDVTNKISNVNNISFYGFPYIPETGGCYANELNTINMQIEINKLKCLLKNNTIDVLLLHCPPTGIYNHQYANHILANMLDIIDNIHKPKIILCGHLHTDNCTSYEFNILISNAATTQNTIKL